MAGDKLDSLVKALVTQLGVLVVLVLIAVVVHAGLGGDAASFGRRGWGSFKFPARYQPVIDQKAVAKVPSDIDPMKMDKARVDVLKRAESILKQDSDNDDVPDFMDPCPSKKGDGENGCPPCKIDTDGKAFFTWGRVGRFTKNPLGGMPKGMKMGKDGIPVSGGPTVPTYEVDFLVEDLCLGNTVRDYYCDVDPSDCVDDVMILGAASYISDMEATMLSSSACVVEPADTVDGGMVAYEDVPCVCGCSGGKCLYETDSDKDGTPDCNDNDDDNDGVKDAVDNCKLIHNPTQQDTDNDGQGDSCDYDDDGDGCMDTVDKWPTTSSTDFDGDGFANDCDMCPQDKDNDGDGDGTCANEDNCPTVPNDQSDIDGDGIGDNCDCKDAKWSPYEAGVDCGGVCQFKCLEQDCKLDDDWCGDDLEPLRLRGKPEDGFIDVVFVPDYRYGSLNQFYLDSEEAVRDGFLKMNDMTDIPFPANSFNKFNFYYYKAGPLDGKMHDYLANSSASCAGEPPATLAGLGGDVAAFRDTTIILCPAGTKGCWGCSSGGPGINHALNVEEDLFNLLLHEAGHGIFSLQDEYCGDKTWYDAAFSPNNIYLSQAACTNDANANGWVNGICTLICAGHHADHTIARSSTGVALWRYDLDVPDNDIMIACGPGCGANYKYHEADARRVNWVFANWPESDTPAILVRLHINGDRITELEQQLMGSHPDLGIGPEHFRVEVLASSGKTVLAYPLVDPRIHLGGSDDKNPGEVYEQADFAIVAPIVDVLESMRIVDPATGKVLIKVDLTYSFGEFCTGHTEYPPCQGKPLSGVSVPGVSVPITPPGTTGP